MNSKFLIVFIFMLNTFVNSYAQEHTQDTTAFIPKTLTAEEFINFQLPSLETLYENAQNNPQLGAIKASIEAAQQDTKQTKRDWLSYFSVHAGFNYGILGTYTDVETEMVPLQTTYSGANQHSWSVGANFSMPLNSLINYKSNIKKQKKIVENLEYTQDITFNQIKSEIIELYSNIQYQLKMLSQATETIIFYKTNYKVAKNDFINNKMTVNELTVFKNSQKKAEAEYEAIMTQLQILLLRLEIITNTKLISK